MLQDLDKTSSQGYFLFQFHFFEQSGNDDPTGVQIIRNFLMGHIKMFTVEYGGFILDVFCKSFLHIMKSDTIYALQHFQQAFLRAFEN